MKFNKKLAIALVSGAAILAGYTQAAAPTQPKLSVQLWSVKDAVSADFEGTLKQLKAYGFQGVEFAGNFGKYGDDPKISFIYSADPKENKSIHEIEIRYVRNNK